MFKKTVLFGILIVVLVVLSGCGTYDPNCSPTGISTCYGKIKLPLPQSDGTCSPAQINISGSCLAVGDTTTCSQLDSQSADSIVKLKWGSVNVPKFNTNLCYPTCQADADCGADAICQINYNQNGINLCSPQCNPTLPAGSDGCLVGLTHCSSVFPDGYNYCVPDSDLATGATATDVIQAVSTVVTPETLQVQPLQLLGSDLIVDLELNRVDRTHAWVNMYLTSAKDKVSSFYIKLNGYGPFGKVELHTLFNSLQTEVHGDNVLLIGGPYTMAPSAKTYVGRVYVDQSGQGAPKPLEITLDPTSYAYDSSNNKFSLTLAPFSACTPLTGSVMSSCTYLNDKVCGALQDGCGGYIDCGQCTGGDVCITANVAGVPGVCKSAVSQVLPANAPQYDKTALQQVSDTLSNAGLSKLQKLSAIVNAVKAWLAAQ